MNRLFAVVALAFAACLKAAPSAIVKDSCKVLEDVTDNGTIKNVCATADEFAWVVDILASARADAGPATEAKKVAACVKLTGTLCATHAEMSKAIDLIVTHRHILDAGVE